MSDHEVTIGRLGLELTMNERTGLLIIRAWIEEGSALPLRAQLRVSTDISAGVERTLTLTRPAEVSAAVLEWLNSIVNGTAGVDSTLAWSHETGEVAQNEAGVDKAGVPRVPPE